MGAGEVLSVSAVAALAVYHSIILLLYLTVGAAADEYEVSKCLPQDGRPILGRPFLKTIMIEYSNWHSHMILGSIFKILLQEHLGYTVVLNHVSGFGRFRRASLVQDALLPGDGEALHDYLRRGEKFVYINPESWIRDEWVDQKKYSIEDNYVISAGGIGYDGEEGIFVPHWLSSPPNNAIFYYSYESNTTRFVSTVEEDAVVRIDCSADRPEVCTGRRPTGSNCTTYCPVHLYGQNLSHLPPIPVLGMKNYAVGFLEQILENNHFYAAIDWHPVESFEATVRTLTSTPFAFYYWEPSILASAGNFSRVFLPNQRCGDNYFTEHSIGSWRCDLPTQMIIKLASSNLRVQAPPAWQFLSKIELSDRFDHSRFNGSGGSSSLAGASITDLLGAVEFLIAVYPDTPPEEHIKQIACKWVIDNEFAGSQWSNWVKHEVPWFAQAEPEKLIPTAFLMVTIMICVVVLHENCLVRSNVFVPLQRRCKAVCLRRISCCLALCGLPRLNRRARSDLGTDDEPTLPTRVCRRRAPTLVTDSCVSFVQPEWVALQDAGDLTVELEREGKMEKSASVRVYTKDLDARSGVDYQGISVECLFEPGQAHASAQVPILYSPTWETSKTFLLCLAPASDNVKVGRLPTANVNIIETDDFPGLGLGAESPPKLMMRRWLFFLMRTNKRHFCLTLLFHMYKAFHETVVMTVVPQLVVDGVLNGGSSSPYYMVLSTTPILLISLLVVRWCERRVLDYNMVGPTEKLLRDHLFRKFWKLPMEVHFVEQFRASTWLTAFLRMTETVFAWAGIFTVSQHMATLVFGTIVTLWLITDHFNTITVDMLIGLSVCCSMPLISLGMVMYCGPGDNYKAKLRQSEHSFDTLIAQLTWVQRNWPILHESNPMLPGMRLLASRFADQNQDYQQSKKLQKHAGDSADWVSVYVSSIATFLFVTFGGFILIERQYYGQGYITVGSYFALIKVFSSFGVAVKKLVQAVTLSSQATVTFASMGELLNIEDRKHRTTEHRHETSCIKLERASFGYGDASHVNLLKNISVCIEPGSAVALHGPPGVGKLTLLRLLGGAIAPTTGDSVLPRAAKVAFLEGFGTFVPGTTVADNICLGSEDRDSPDSDILMQVLGLSEYETVASVATFRSSNSKTAALLGYGTDTVTRKDSSFGFGSGRIGPIKDHTTFRQQLLVQLARVLLTDPDLLFLNFNNLPMDSRTERIFGVLRLWRMCATHEFFIAALERVVPDGCWDPDDSDRWLAEAADHAEARKPAGSAERTMVVIVPEACVQANPQWLRRNFTATLHLASRSSCVYTPLTPERREKQFIAM